MLVLSIKGDRLLDTHGKEIAALAETLKPEIKSSYINLFATAPQLFEFLAGEVSSAVQYIEERSKIRGRVRDGYMYFPKWLDHAANIVAFAQGLERNLTGAKLYLTQPEGGEGELRDKQENIVLRFAGRLNQSEIDRYANLFIAAPALLEIAEAMCNEGLTAMRNEYEAGAKFDPAGADTYRFIIPDRLKFISDMVSKARGAVPLPDNTASPLRNIGQKLWSDLPDRNLDTKNVKGKRTPAQMYRGNLIVSASLFFVGIVILGIMSVTSKNHSNLVKHGRYASGKVLGCIDEARHVPKTAFWDGKRNFLMPIKYVDKCYKYQIEFQPVSGNKVDLVGGPNTKNEEVNGAVTILYMADDPEHTAIIDDPPSDGLWGMGISFCLLSIFFLWAAHKAKLPTGRPTI